MSLDLSYYNFIQSFTPAGKPVPGATLINEKAGITIGQGFGIEMLITFVLVLVVFAAAADENNAINVKGSAPLAIGLSITTCHLFAVRNKDILMHVFVKAFLLVTFQ